MDVQIVYLCLACIANVTGVTTCPDEIDALCRPGDAGWKR